MFEKLFDRILYPQKVLKILAKKEQIPVLKTLYESVNTLSNNLAREKLKSPDIDIVITPSFNNLNWTDFDQVDKFIELGEIAAVKEIPNLKKKLRLA